MRRIDKDTLYVQALIPPNVPDELRVKVYENTRNKFFCDLGRAIYEAEGIHTVEVSETVEKGRNFQDADVLRFSARFTAVQFRHVIAQNYLPFSQLTLPELKWHEKIGYWLKKKLKRR